MDAKASTMHASPSIFAPFLAMLAALLAHAGAVGRKFHQDIGAESNPVKDVAVGFILIAIALVIALTILPVITSAVNTAQGDANVSASDGTLLGLLPTLLIVGLVGGGVAFLFRAFKNIKS